jgi:hypothetical protein
MKRISLLLVLSVSLGSCAAGARGANVKLGSGSTVEVHHYVTISNVEDAQSIAEILKEAGK